MGRAEDSSPSDHNSLSFMEQYDLRHVLAEVACGTRILLVDDDILNQAAMLRLLQHLGFSLVDTARNGAEAVNLVKRSPFSYDCILLDITMPVMDGLEAASQIREIDTDVLLIALTGNVSKGTAVASLSKGMNDCITKPIHQKQLMRALLKLLKT
ncbi:CheY-like superfamily [Aspergillus novoparasiticus]|uniref:CheY-like superfamily n=1 Tax=Aspergillus novoparasiticus TaxID=986946 RepID=A0A5N6ETW6_9EURO|nr:CheY-like superfamily [Aspergillus novoparasiticus]